MVPLPHERDTHAYETRHPWKIGTHTFGYLQVKDLSFQIAIFLCYCFYRL